MRETVDKIRTAEADAEKMKRLAQEKTDSEVAEAREKGKKHVKAAVSEAEQTARRLIKEAEEKAFFMADEKIRSAEKETESLMEAARSRIEQASGRIVEGIVGDI